MQIICHSRFHDKVVWAGNTIPCIFLTWWCLENIIIMKYYHPIHQCGLIKADPSHPKSPVRVTPNRNVQVVVFQANYYK